LFGWLFVRLFYCLLVRLLGSLVGWLVGCVVDRSFACLFALVSFGVVWLVSGSVWFGLFVHPCACLFACLFAYLCVCLLVGWLVGLVGWFACVFNVCLLGGSFPLAFRFAFL